MSLSFEEYIQLHKQYNTIVSNNCASDLSEAFTSDLIKFNVNEDQTLYKTSHNKE